MSFSLTRSATRWFPVLGLVLLLGACAVRLAPNYDPSIVNGLTAVNVETLTLFQAVGQSPKSGYAARAETYNEVIAKYEAIQMLAQHRPDPQSAAGGWLEDELAKIIEPAQVDGIDVKKTPTPAILTTILKTLGNLRNDDKGGRLNAAVLGLYKNEYAISYAQAIKYEQALRR